MGVKSMPPKMTVKMKLESMDSEMLTTSEAAKLLRVHPNTIRQWANKRLLHAYRLGPRGDRRFKRKDIEFFITLDKLLTKK
jgi:excisionase family DNA binding protein